MNSNKKIIGLTVVTGSLLVLTSCDWLKKTEEPTSSTATEVGAPSSSATKTDVPASEVLYSVDGKPLITLSDFEEYVKAASDAQPQLKQLMAFMPDAEYQLFTNLVNEKIVQEWAQRNKIDQRADYQRDKKLGTELLDRQLAVKYFQEEQSKKIQVSDADARKWYDEHKETEPGLAVSPGGVKAKGIKFDTEAAAQAFLNKAKDPANFAKVAKEQGLTVKDFKEVNQQSFDIDGAVRDKLLAMKKFPSVELVKGKDTFWVVNATGKEDAKYIPFEQIKEQVKNQLKMEKLFTQELESIKKSFKGEENKAYFERKKKEQEEQVAKMMEQQQKAQESQKKSAQADVAPANPPATVKGA